MTEHVDQVLALSDPDIEGRQAVAQFPSFETVACPTGCSEADNYPHEGYMHLRTAVLVLTDCAEICVVPPCTYCFLNPFEGPNPPSPDPDDHIGGIIHMIHEQDGCTGQTSTTSCTWCFGDVDGGDELRPSDCNGVDGMNNADLTGQVYRAGTFCVQLGFEPGNEFWGWLLFVGEGYCDLVPQGCGPFCETCDEFIWYAVYLKPNTPEPGFPDGHPYGRYFFQGGFVFDDQPGHIHLCGSTGIIVPSTLIIDNDPNPHPPPP